jgi:hypothetical protein
LLSEPNVELRETFHKMMKSHNHPEIHMTDSELEFLYRRVEAFVRGMNQFASVRKVHYVPPDQEDLKRKPLFEGGYIMESKEKREFRKQQMHSRIGKTIDPEQLILEWTEEEEKYLSELFIGEVTNSDFIIENMKVKFGESDKWRDFQILGRKLDHLIILGLDKMQRLTSNANFIYNKLEKMAEDEAKAKKEDKDTEEKASQYGPNNFQDLTGLVYKSRKGCKEIREGGIIKNPSLLLKQIYASTESYRVKQKVVRLLIDKYPEEEDVLETLNEIKEFTDQITREEEKNHITLVRRRPPVFEYGRGSSVASLYDERSEMTKSIVSEDYEQILRGTMKLLGSEK